MINRTRHNIKAYNTILNIEDFYYTCALCVWFLSIKCAVKGIIQNSTDKERERERMRGTKYNELRDRESI